MITLTERAAKKIQALASKKGLPPMLRVKVGAGGCSGMSYEFAVAIRSPRAISYTRNSARRPSWTRRPTSSSAALRWTTKKAS